MNIVIPMAGYGERFLDAGFSLPKPLIPVDGKPMFLRAIESLGIDGRWIFVIRSEHSGLIVPELRKCKPRCHVIEVGSTTDGPARSVLLASPFIDNDDCLVTANCDQIMAWDAKRFKNAIRCDGNNGLVVTYESNTPKNSYALVEGERVVRIEEKKVISNESLNGIHCWKRGSDFVRSARQMIAVNDRANGEFYIAPTYNYLIAEGRKIVCFRVGINEHWPVGTPDDLKLYNDFQKLVDREDI